MKDQQSLPHPPLLPEADFPTGTYKRKDLLKLAGVPPEHAQAILDGNYIAGGIPPEHVQDLRDGRYVAGLPQDHLEAIRKGHYELLDPRRAYWQDKLGYEQGKLAFKLLQPVYDHSFTYKHYMDEDVQRVMLTKALEREFMSAIGERQRLIFLKPCDLASVRVSTWLDEYLKFGCNTAFTEKSFPWGPAEEEMRRSSLYCFDAFPEIDGTMRHRLWASLENTLKFVWLHFQGHPNRKILDPFAVRDLWTTNGTGLPIGFCEKDFHSRFAFLVSG